MRRREPGFPVFCAVHEMVMQREMRRGHARWFQIGGKMAIANSVTLPEARKKLAGGATTGSAPHHPKPPPRPGRAREGHAGSGGQHPGGHSHASRAPAGAPPVSGGGGVARFRWFHHRLISFEPPARQNSKAKTTARMQHPVPLGRSISVEYAKSEHLIRPRGPRNQVHKTHPFERRSLGAILFAQPHENHLTHGQD